VTANVIGERSCLPPKTKKPTRRKGTVLPEKICVACGRPFRWRKKWQRDWADVKFCSERCRRNKRAR
jgi:hypothetical protein